VALAVVLSIWGLNLFAVVCLARHNQWKHPWKMIVAASFFVGPLAILLWWTESCGRPVKDISMKATFLQPKSQDTS
jgi:hypothetical protein